MVLDNFKKFTPFILSEEYSGFLNEEKISEINENIMPNKAINIQDDLLVRNHSKYPNYYVLLNFFYKQNWIQELNSLIQPTLEIKELAQIAISKMGKYHCIHVRRGDMLYRKNNPGLKYRTEPKYLEKYLLKKIPKGDNLYIMSNETTCNFFDPLKNSFDVFTSLDFPEYISVQQKDNYLLFSIENTIMDQAQVKVKTFKEDGYDSLVNYTSMGKEFFKSRMRRRWRTVKKVFFKKLSG